MNRSKLAAGLYLCLVFVSGTVVGAIGYRLYTASAYTASPASASTAAKQPRLSPEEYRRRYVEEMRTRLKLSDAQVTQLRQLMDDTRRQFQQYHEKTEPQLKAINEGRKAIQAEYHQKIRDLLDDNQKAEYEKMVAERERRRQQRQQQSKDRS